MRAPKRPSNVVPRLLGRTAWDKCRRVRASKSWEGQSGHPILASKKVLPRPRGESEERWILRPQASSATGSAARLGQGNINTKMIELTHRTCPHRPCSKEERYRKSPHLSRIQRAPCVPFSSGAKEGILTSEPVVKRRKLGESACGGKG